jgi:hemoglobin/transferrin/lactoferrin receptor protein
VDLLAEWRVSPRTRLNIGLFNLTDEAYIEWADVRGRIADDVLVPYYTQPGFNAAATLHYDF